MWYVNLCSLYLYVFLFWCFKWIARHAFLTLGSVYRIKRRICLKSVVLLSFCKLLKLTEEMKEEDGKGGQGHRKDMILVSGKAEGWQVTWWVDVMVVCQLDWIRRPSVCAKLIQSCLTLQKYGLKPIRLLCPWHFPAEDTGVGCHALLQEILLTPG